MEKDNRIYGMDIVRIIAVLLVLSVHFFLRTNYYNITDYDISMKIQSIIRSFCMICVPLFMTITGFLNKKEEYNKSFFKGLINILVIWIFYSIIEYFTLNLMNGTTDNLNFKSLLHSITTFNACEYSWYIEMYIGLYLISPVINVAYNSFSKKNRKILVIIAVTNLIVVNFINQVFGNILHFPNWWIQMYPIAYYICGKYISDIKPNFKKKNLLVLLMFNVIISSSYSFITPQDYNDLITFINTILVFLLFYDIKVKGKVKQKVLKYISSITLDIYLASSLVDKIIYPIFNSIFKSYVPVNTQSYIILAAPIVIIVIFIICIIFASIRKLLINIR